MLQPQIATSPGMASATAAWASVLSPESRAGASLALQAGQQLGNSWAKVFAGSRTGGTNKAPFPGLLVAGAGFEPATSGL